MFDLSYRPTLTDLHPLIPDIDMEGAIRISGRESFVGCAGYDPAFLGEFHAPWPTLVHTNAGDVLPVPGSPDNRLDYTHFSVTMSASRRMAVLVGVNISGADHVKIRRTVDRWAYDGRIAVEAQVGNELYSNTLLDRGHLVRREDPNWGPNAEVANNQTFHFSNCVPQMGKFNQRTWLSLEDYVLKSTRVLRERVTVFSGPVFAKTDREYRGVLIPEAFWKVVAFVSNEGRPSTTAYIIGQTEELSELEAAFGRFQTYQCSVRSIEGKTGLDFGPLRDLDGFSNSEISLPIPILREITRGSDILV
jgi:endonuclease G